MTSLTATLPSRRSPALRTGLAVAAALVLAVAASTLPAAAGPRPGVPAASAQPRVLVLVNDPALLPAAADALRRAHLAGTVRASASPTEQLSVTRYFAARRFTTIVTIGAPPAIAVDPVRARYPATRFAALPDPRHLEDALRTAR